MAITLNGKIVDVEEQIGPWDKARLKRMAGASNGDLRIISVDFQPRKELVIITTPNGVHPVTGSNINRSSLCTQLGIEYKQGSIYL